MKFVSLPTRKAGNYLLVLLSFLAIGAFLIVPTVGFQYPLTNVLVIHASLVPVEGIRWMIWIYLIAAFLSLGALLAWLVLYSIKQFRFATDAVFLASASALFAGLISILFNVLAGANWIVGFYAIFGGLFSLFAFVYGLDKQAYGRLVMLSPSIGLCCLSWVFSIFYLFLPSLEGQSGSYQYWAIGGNTSYQGPTILQAIYQALAYAAIGMTIVGLVFLCLRRNNVTRIMAITSFGFMVASMITALCFMLVEDGMLYFLVFGLLDAVTLWLLFIRTKPSKLPQPDTPTKQNLQSNP